MNFVLVFSFEFICIFVVNSVQLATTKILFSRCETVKNYKMAIKREDDYKK